MNKIVCLSTTAWYAHPTRKQEVMRRIPNAEILYFDPAITFIAPLKDKKAVASLTSYRTGGKKVTDNITVYSLPPVLPLYNKKRQINRINQRRLGVYIRRIMQKHGFGNDAILWVYHPSYADIVEYIPHSALVYDCVDRHSAYPGLIDPTVVDNMEADLASKCNMVFATADGLYDTLKNYNPNTMMIPNGANYELFNSVTKESTKIPDELSTIKRPVIGFAGAIQKCIDTDLVVFAAKARPDWSFVFVGNPLPGVDVSPLEALPNVHLLGRKPQSELPGYLKGFDICLLLFRSDDLSKDVSPLKFYEYLATGKPIISGEYPKQVMAYKDAVYVYNTNDQFLKVCQQALSEKDKCLESKRIAYGAACSWDSRVEQICDALRKIDILD